MGAEQRQIPARTCVLCRNRRQKDVLFRIVRTPEGDIVFDKTGKLNGRGAYVCRDDGCWDDDVYRGKLQAALKIEIDDSTFKLLYRSINSVIDE
ncbi:MAG: hypothetical protein CL741_04950 [Chloroflexi bacterium]|nr:hypothetical protein [Chloroflexota bacterium]